MSKRHMRRRLDQSLVQKAALAGENAYCTQNGFPPLRWKDLDRRDKREMLQFTEGALIPLARKTAGFSRGEDVNDHLPRTGTKP